MSTERSEAYVFATAIALLGASLFMLLSGTTSAKELPSDEWELLDRVAQSQRAKYHAKQLVVYFGKPQSTAVLDVRSTGEGRYVRAVSGTSVTRLWKGPDGDIVSGNSSLKAAAQPVELRPETVLQKYDVALGPAESPLGVSLIPLTLTRRRDGLKVERWLVHPKSGVVYSRELFGIDGQVVGMTTITEMAWGDPPPAERFEEDAERPGTVTSKSTNDAPSMLPHGYRFQRCYWMKVHGTQAEQWVYSDGVHALSVFNTKDGLRSPDGFVKTDVDGVWAGPGPGTWAWEGDGRSWIAVAEEPSLDAAEMTHVFPRGGPSFGARLGNLWSRIFNAIGDVFS